MSDKPVVCKVNQIEGKIGHGGAVNVKILVDDLTCGAKNFSFLVNTMVYVPPGTMHFVWANEGEDFTYIIVYAPSGPEKAL